MAIRLRTYLKRKNTTPESNKPFIFYGIQKVVPNDGFILVYIKRDQNKRLLFWKWKIWHNKIRKL